MKYSECQPIPHITAESVEPYTKLELLAIINALQQQFQQQVQQLQARIVELEEKAAALSKNSFSAYTKYANRFQQFCLAHLIRDIKFLTTLPDIANQQFGIRLLPQTT